MPAPPMDMVFTWVDGADPAHAARRDAAKRANGRQGPSVPERSRWYDSLGEIGFGVRSALACMPWLRTIHIVTDGQVPPVDAELIRSGRVRIVDHAEIIPEQYRPAFASTVIESFLHRIPGLSEVYLYNNDDFMHGRVIARQEFCTASGLLRLRTVPAMFRAALRLAADWAPPFLPQANPYTAGISNSARLCRRLGLPWRDIVFPRHLTQVYRVATAREVEQRFAEELHSARLRHFRSAAQLSWSTLAYSAECHMHGAHRQGYRPWPGKGPADELFIDLARHGSARRQAAAWQKVMRSQAAFICLNNIPPGQAEAYRNAMEYRGLGPGVPE